MIKINTTLSATFAALIAQVIFGFSFMFTKIALQYATPLVVIADRYLVAFFCMCIIMILTKTRLHFTKNIWKLFIMALFQPILYFLFETYGIRMTTSSFSAVMIAMIPVVSMIGGSIFLKEMPTKMQYLFTVVSVLGVVMMALLGTAEGTVTPVGILLLVGAVIASAAYNIISRKISSEFSSMERTFVMMLTGFVVFFILGLGETLCKTQNWTQFAGHYKHLPYHFAIGYLGIISSVTAFFLLNYANTHLPVSKTTAFSNLTTVVSVFAGVIFLQESFSWQAFLATAMIVIGVWGVQIQKVRIQDDNYSS